MMHRVNRTLVVVTLVALGCGGGSAPSGPSLSIGDVIQPEGDSGLTPFVFTVTLSEVLSEDVSFDWTTADGSATVLGSDYVAGAGMLTIPAGTTICTITVQVIGDIDVDLDETFSVTISNPVNAAIADGQAVGVIQCDDG